MTPFLTHFFSSKYKCFPCTVCVSDEHTRKLTPHSSQLQNLPDLCDGEHGSNEIGHCVDIWQLSA